jgi:hypothetical protein
LAYLFIGQDTVGDQALHVIISGDSDEAVVSAAEAVRRLLVPIDESVNVHKRAQLRQLAEINGTLSAKSSYVSYCLYVRFVVRFVCLS